MTLYKLTKNRASFSFYKYFIKAIFVKNMKRIESFPSASKTSRFLDKQGIAYCPRMIFQTRFLCLYIEGYENVKSAQPLTNEKGTFYRTVEDVLFRMPIKHNNVSWHAILAPEILNSIQHKPEIYNYIEVILGDKKYNNTGMHGDLNPNNVLIDRDQNFWIVDWENHSENGSVLWDLYWFYGIWKRSTPKPPDDIISIYNHVEKSYVNKSEMLLIYALMKFRLDLQRHNKTSKIALENFFQRVSAIMVMC